MGINEVIVTVTVFAAVIILIKGACKIYVLRRELEFQRSLEASRNLSHARHTAEAEKEYLELLLEEEQSERDQILAVFRAEQEEAWKKYLQERKQSEGK